MTNEETLIVIVGIDSGWEALDRMDWKHRKYLIDQMFDGTDEDGRAYGVYVRHIKGKVFDYEIYGKFAAGARFMKNEDDNYLNGPELEEIYAEWDCRFQADRAAYEAKKKIVVWKWAIQDSNL